MYCTVAILRGTQLLFGYVFFGIFIHLLKLYFWFTYLIFCIFLTHAFIYYNNAFINVFVFKHAVNIK